MKHIHLICLGKLKETYWREAAAEYLKRLSPFVKVMIHELKEESFSEKDNPEIIKEREAKKIEVEIEKISDSYIIALDEHGKQLSSVGFARQFDQLTNQQINQITFILGGPLGLHESIRQRAHLTLSLSPFTFTHQMARVFLLEQLYRAMMIAHGRSYHY